MALHQQASWVLYDTDLANEDKSAMTPPEAAATKRQYDIVWRNVAIYILMHCGALYGGYLALFKVKWQTFFFGYFYGIAAGLGITAGVHRLWAHRAYKAKLPLRIMLAFFNTIAFQESILDWSRDHRTHHKYSETDADPHNALRGFFYSHVGWLLVKKLPEVKAKGQEIDVSDLLADPVVAFQKKYYYILMPLLSFILPTFLPTYWGESVWNSFFVCALLRFVWVLNVTWLVNSAGHMFGNKPYDRSMKPVENRFLSIFVFGEGFHNFHHSFPWDYKSAELGGYSFNVTKLFIDAMALIGLAYDLKSVPVEVVKMRVKRTGDGSHDVWGWDDKDVLKEDKDITVIENKKIS